MAGDSSTTRCTWDDDNEGRGGTTAPTRSGATHAVVDESTGAIDGPGGTARGTGATEGTLGLDSLQGIDGVADDERVTRVGDVPGTIGAAGAPGTEAAGTPSRCTASTAPAAWLVGAPDEARGVVAGATGSCQRIGTGAGSPAGECWGGAATVTGETRSPRSGAPSCGVRSYQAADGSGSTAGPTSEPGSPMALSGRSGASSGLVPLRCASASRRGSAASRATSHETPASGASAGSGCGGSTGVVPTGVVLTGVVLTGVVLTGAVSIARSAVGGCAPCGIGGVAGFTSGCVAAGGAAAGGMGKDSAGDAGPAGRRCTEGSVGACAASLGDAWA